MTLTVCSGPDKMDLVGNTIKIVREERGVRQIVVSPSWMDVRSAVFDEAAKLSEKFGPPESIEVVQPLDENRLATRIKMTFLKGDVVETYDIMRYDNGTAELSPFT